MVNCFECKFDKVCCSNKFGVTLSRKEIKKYKNKRITNLKENNLIIGLVYILDNKDGFCSYFDKKTGLCSIYEDRPETCKNYDCTGKIL